MCTPRSGDEHPKASTFDSVSPCQCILDFREDHCDGRFYFLGFAKRVGISDLSYEF